MSTNISFLFIFLSCSPIFQNLLLHLLSHFFFPSSFITSSGEISQSFRSQNIHYRYANHNAVNKTIRTLKPPSGSWWILLISSWVLFMNYNRMTYCQNYQISATEEKVTQSHYFSILIQKFSKFSKVHHPEISFFFRNTTSSITSWSLFKQTSYQPQN